MAERAAVDCLAEHMGLVPWQRTVLEKVLPNDADPQARPPRFFLLLPPVHR